MCCSLRETISEVNSFSKHVSCLSCLSQWHSESISKSASYTLSLEPVPQHELVVNFVFKWWESKLLGWFVNFINVSNLNIKLWLMEIWLSVFNRLVQNLINVWFFVELGHFDAQLLEKDINWTLLPQVESHTSQEYVLHLNNIEKLLEHDSIALDSKKMVNDWRLFHPKVVRDCSVKVICQWTYHLWLFTCNQETLNLWQNLVASPDFFWSQFANWKLV